MDLPKKQYRTVVIDPPWPSSGYLARKHGKPIHRDFAFPVMTLEEIGALDLPSILQDDAFVFLWTINRFVAEVYDLLAE